MYIFQGLVQVATFSFKALQSCCSRCRQEEPKSANQNVGESSPLLSSEKRNESEDELTIDSLPLDAEEQTQHSLTAEFESFSKSMEAVKICLIHTTLYYTLAIVGYSFLVEKWSIIDSLYFSTTIFTTIGYGDLAPTNVYAECYTMCLALYGIVLLGLFLGIAGEKIIDGQNKAIQESQEKLRKRIMQGSSNGLQAGAKAITESMRENARERSLLEEIGEVFVLELPILAVVILLMTIAGYFEGWTWFQR